MTFIWHVADFFELFYIFNFFDLSHFLIQMTAAYTLSSLDPLATIWIECWTWFKIKQIKMV